MQVFEFYFNPRTKTKLRLPSSHWTPDLIFDSFCHEPENIYDNRMGSLYMVGLLKNILPKNLQFLERIARIIKERFYRSVTLSPEKSLRESLKEANEFFEATAKRGDVSWLGNLSFAVLSLKNFKLNFTKVGNIKIYLLRGGKVIDIDKKLNLQDIEPYPLRIFGNIISGKLAEDDLLLVLTEEVFNFFQQENLLETIAQLPHFSEKEFKEIINKAAEKLALVSGICLAVLLKKEVLASKKETILPRLNKEFSLKEVFEPLFKLLGLTSKKTKKEKGGGRKKAVKKVQKLYPVAALKSLKESFEKKLRFFSEKKKVSLVLIFILVLIFGYFFSRSQENQKINSYQKDLGEIQENINLAQSYLILENPQLKKRANQLLQENLERVSLILKETRDFPKNFNSQVSSLNEKILTELYKLNGVEEIQEPKLVFQFEAEKFIPQKIFFSGGIIYSYSPYAKNILFVKENGESGVIETDNKISQAADLGESILFFSKPNQLITLKEGNFSFFSLKEPYPEFSFDDFSCYKESLYFFDKKAGQIIKYPYNGNLSWNDPELWLKKSTVGKALTVDGLVWILEKDNSIGKYKDGVLQEKLDLGIFPQPKDFSKITTSPSLSSLFLIEPVQKRVVIVSKTGQIIRQLRSERFDNLLDLALSSDGKEIFLLNGMKIFKIEL